MPSETHAPINHIFIIGAGTMGRDIALQCARHGVRVTVYDASPAALEAAAQHFRDAAALPDAATLQTAPDLSALPEGDLIIECVPENLVLKRDVFTRISALARPDAILATNTSSLIPSQFIDVCRHPDRLVAFHFHLPVATSTIVDIMPHPGTAPDIVPRLDAFARRIGQFPIHYAREHHAYIFNSLFGAMQRQALDLVIDGVARFEDVDRSWMGIFNMGIGPFGMFDGIGLDTIAEILNHWAETLNDDAGRRRVAFLKRWTDQGACGIKSSRGFYAYPNPAFARPDFLSVLGDQA